MTFDSSATPTVGNRVTVPRLLAAVDLSTLRKRLATETITKNKDGLKNVAQLRQRLAQLEQQLLTQPVERVEVSVFQDGEVQRLEAALESLLDFGNRAIAIAEAILTALEGVSLRLDVQPDTTPQQQVQPNEEGFLSVITPPQQLKTIELTKPQQRILDALAQFEVTGVSAITRHNLAVFSDQSPTSSGYTNNLGRLRSSGFIDYPSSGKGHLTPEGRLQTQAQNKVMSLSELHNAWYAKLSKPQANILRSLLQVYPDVMAKEVLAQKVQQSSTSSGYTNNLGTLRSLGLIDYLKPGLVVATNLLFPLMPKK